MRDILLIDKSQFAQCVPYLKGVLRQCKEVDMSGKKVPGVLTALEAEVRRDRTKIRFLVIVDHGGLGKQQMGNGDLEFNAKNRPHLQRLGRVNCTRIYFLGCILTYPSLNINTGVGRMLNRQIVASQAMVDHHQNGVFSASKFVRFEANGSRKDEPNQITDPGGLAMNIRYQLQFRP